MPFDQYNTPGEVRRREQKNIQQGQSQGQAANPPGSTPSNYDTAYNQIQTVYNSSRGTLSTANVLYLSGLSQQDRELARLGSLFARNFAVPPWYVFGTHDPKKYVSPITGKHLTVKDARLFSNNFGAVPLTSMLKPALDYYEGSGVKTSRGVQQANRVTLDPTLVGKFARALADQFPDLSMTDALGASIHAAKLGYNPKTFSNNLDMISRWYSASGAQVDERQALFYANLITSQGKRLKSVNDVVGALFGKGTKQATQAAEAQVSGANTPYKNTTGTGLAIPGVQPTTQQQAYQNLQDAAIRGDQPVPLMRGETFTPQNVNDYWQQVQVEANRVAMDDAASQNSFFNKFVMVPVGKAMNAFNVIYDKAFGGAVYVARVPIAALAAAGSPFDPQHDSASANWQQVMAAGRYQASRLWSAQESPGSLIAEPMGDKYKHWVGPGLDLLIQWALDPGVLAGEARANYLEKFVLPGELDHTNALRSALEWTGEKLPLSDRFVTEAGAAEDAAVKLWSNRVAKFAESKISRRIFEASADDTKANRIIYRLRGKVEARGTLDMQFMTALRDKIQEAMVNGDRVDSLVVSPTLNVGRGETVHDIIHNPVVSAAIDDPNYVYHAATASSEDSIAKNGLIASLNKDRPGELKGTYFGDGAADLDSLLPQRGQDIVIYRMSKDRNLLQKSDIFSGSEGEWVAPRDIPPSKLERLGSDGNWHPVTETGSKGISKEQAWQEWQDGIKAHFLGVAPEGSVAADVVAARLNQGFRTDKIVADATPAKPSIWQGHSYVDKNGLLVPETAPQAMVNDAMGLHDTSAFPGWLRTEVPGTTPLSEWGPRRIVRSAITSPRLTETAFGKRLAAIPNMNPGRLLDFNNAPEQYVAEHATRWATFSETQVQEYATKIAEIVNSGRMVETRIQDLVDQLNIDAVKQILSKYNISDEERARLTSDLLDPPQSAKALTEQAFGAIDGEGIYRPLTEAQLRNQMYVVDPIVVRQGIRDYISMRDRMWQTLSHALGKEAPEVGTKTITTIGHGAVVKGANTMGDLYRTWLRFWKAGTVARPGYIPRVVLGDENARFLATTSSAGDRLLSIAFGHRAAEDPNFAKSFLDNTFGDTIKVGDSTIDVPRAGAFEYEAAAAGKVREADIINELEHGKNFLTPVMKSDGSWGVIPPTDPAHMADWTYGLTRHIRGTAPGDLALASVASGDSVSETAAKLVQWAKDDKYYTLAGRIGVRPADVGDWADQFSKVVHGYTMNDPEVAKVVIEGNRDKIAQILNAKYPNLADRPDVHGPTMAKLADGGADPRLLNRFVNFQYDTWLRRPEDALNRQPFFAVWKRRAQTAMYKAMDAQGIDLTANGYKLTTVPGRTGVTLPDIQLTSEQMVPRAATGDAQGYLYHISPPDNIESIKTNGLLPKQSFYGIPEEQIPAHMQGDRLFFADSLDRAKQLAHNGGEALAFRVKASDVGDVIPEAHFTGSQFGRSAIPASKIEVLASDGKWYPLDETGHFVSPKLRQVVDRASTDFALGQVRRVMFDFTKQSRFTELLQFAFPFPQPFFEGFQAWGHIAYRNPTSIAHARILFNAAVNSGFFKKDPISGEYMVPAGVWRQPAIWTAIALGGDPKLMKQLDTPWLPLSNLNLLTAANIKFGAQGPLGKAIGGVPIPVPSLNPLIAGALMKAFANTRSPVLQGYLFQYGAEPQYLPGPLQAVTKVLFPDAYKNDASKQSMALAVTEALHRYGLDKDEQGRPLPLNDAEIPAWEAKYGTKFTGQTLEQIAAKNTDALYEMRPWISMLMPTAARLAFDGQRTDYQAWETMLNQNGGDYQKAYDQWLSQYPDKFMIPAGKTWTGPGEGDSTGVRVPASELTYQMLRMPGVGDFMRTYKPWAALLLVGIDPAIQDKQNFAAFSDLMAKGFESYKTPAEYYQSGADNVGWSKYDVFQQQIWYPAFDKGVKKFGSVASFEQSDAYNQLKTQRQQFFDSMYRTDPHWVLANLKPQYAPDGTTVWDWPQDYTGPTPTQVTRAHARDIVNMPELQSFPGVQALKEYMDGTDALIQKMQDKRVTDITSDKAKTTGLWGQYQKIVQKTLSDQPELAPFLTKYFGVQLTDQGADVPLVERSGAPQVTGTNDLVYNMSERQWAFQDVVQNLKDKGLSDAAANQILDNVVQLDTHLTALKHAAGTAPLNSYQRSLDYKKVDDLINTTYNQAPQVLHQWWKAQGPTYQQQYKEFLATKPVEFYTAFDYSLTGTKLTKTAQKWMSWISDKRLEIDRKKQADPTYTASTGYDQIDAYVKSKLGKDKTFDSAIKAMNTPGWGVDNILGYGLDTQGQVVKTQGTSLDRSKYDSKGDYLWAQFLRVTRQATDALQKGGYSGVNYGSDSERKAYRSVQDQVGKIAQHYKRESPQFAEMWDSLQKQYGDTLIQNLFIPDDLFPPIGG